MAERQPIPRPDLAPGATSPAAPTAERKDWSDLGLRIASSLILAPAGIAAAWFGGPWLAAACGAAVVAMSYEWARMSEPQDTQRAFLFALAGALGAVLFASWRELAWGMGWLALCSIASALRRKTMPQMIETLGAIYIGAPCAMFLWLRLRAPEGLDTMLALFAMIWSADVFAYLGGKLIGGPKIASGLSPNKTWSGIIAGALAGAGAGYTSGVVFHSPNTGIWLGVGALIAFTGLMGDLFESFLKRRFRVKDASGFIPGHGGVLDRIDGLMAATLLSGVILAFWPHTAAFLFRGAL